MTYRTFPLCALLLLAACGPGNSGKSPPPKLFEEQREALDKSKAVDAAQQKTDEEQRKAIEKQTQ